MTAIKLIIKIMSIEINGEGVCARDYILQGVGLSSKHSLIIIITNLSYFLKPIFTKFIKVARVVRVSLVQT